MPKLYTLLDTVNLDAAGITQVQNQPVLKLTGQDIILGFIDTGIDYTHPAFRRSDGSSRIYGLWDQTVQTGTPPYDLEYGSVYTRQEINQALALEDPYSLVPSQDEIGHGTALAGIAAGTALPENDFAGAAPQAMIAVVKLKPAKEYLKSFFYVTGDAPAYQMTDIMAGIRYLIRLSEELLKPLVICLGLGTSQGAHSGDSPLDSMLSVTNQFRGIIGVSAAGNEAGRAHHYYGTALNSTEYNAVEILVKEGTRGFCAELWGQPPEVYAVGFESPLGRWSRRFLPASATVKIFLLSWKTPKFLSVLKSSRQFPEASLFLSVSQIQLPDPGKSVCIQETTTAAAIISGFRSLVFQIRM